MNVLISIQQQVKQWQIPADGVDALRRRFPHIRFVHATTEEQRVAGLGRAWCRRQDFLEFGLGLPKVVLDVVRLADPVLGVGHQRMLGILGDEVQKIEDRLTVLARPKGGQCGVVCLLGRS